MSQKELITIGMNMGWARIVTLHQFTTHIMPMQEEILDPKPTILKIETNSRTG